MELLMRTTLTIDGEVLAQFKRLAADTHRSLSSVIEEALRGDLVRRRATGDMRSADLPVVHGGRLLQGVDLSSNVAVQRVLDEGLPFDKLR
jgi:predicted transcriptional regulator